MESLQSNGYLIMTVVSLLVVMTFGLMAFREGVGRESPKYSPAAARSSFWSFVGATILFLVCQLIFAP